MIDAALQLNDPNDTVASAPMQRARGEARVSFKQLDGRTRLDDLYQSGCAKVRLPRVYDPQPVAVLINTAGGITGGDRISYDASTRKGASALVTTQAAERAYRKTTGAGMVKIGLKVADGSHLEWLPQETILFDASALSRSMTAHIEGNGRLLALESVVLGRTGMGEKVEDVFFKDRWRIYRDDRLQFADDIRIDGNSLDILKGKATGDGKIAFATLLECAPDAEDRIGLAREALALTTANSTVKAAASAWNGILTARFVAHDGRTLREALITFLQHYRSRPVPRVWNC